MNDADRIDAETHDRLMSVASASGLAATRTVAQEVVNTCAAFLEGSFGAREAAEYFDNIARMCRSRGGVH